MIFIAFLIYREEEFDYASSLSYSYSYSYDSESKKNARSEHVTTELDNESKGLIDAETLTDSNNFGTSSNFTAVPITSLTTMADEENVDETIKFLKSEVVASDGNSTESTSSLTKAMVGVGVGCAILVALLSLSKRQR